MKFLPGSCWEKMASLEKGRIFFVHPTKGSESQAKYCRIKTDHLKTHHLFHGTYLYRSTITFSLGVKVTVKRGFRCSLLSLFYFSDLLQPLLLCRERWFGKRKAEDSLIKGFINSHFAIPSVKRIF